MLNRLFGNYLIENQILTNEQLDDLLPVEKGFKAEVETIAVISKVFTAAVARELLAQMDKGTERFGEVAVEAGQLTDEKLDQLLGYQSNSFMRFVQTLLDRELIRLEQVNPLLDEFQETGGYNAAQLNALIHDDLVQCINIFVPLKSERLKELIFTLAQTMRRLVDCDMYLGKAYTARSFQLGKYACQAIFGDMHVKVYISAPDNGLLAIANHFSGDTFETVDADALDSVGEFINCANGLFATNMSYDDISVDMSSPEYSLEGSFLSNEKLYILPVYANGYGFKAVLEVYE